MSQVVSEISQMVKAAQDILPTRKLERDERNKLLEALPVERKKQILKFIAEEINKNRDAEKSYIVKAKADRGKGRFTYFPESDKLIETDRNIRDNARHDAWKRAWLWAAV